MLIGKIHMLGNDNILFWEFVDFRKRRKGLNCNIRENSTFGNKVDRCSAGFYDSTRYEVRVRIVSHV